ncbi:hypothetical protein SCP_0116050 [Sparassis crispa]|uniref:Uncharacterized protein n=1 Tax=Sparassis crispa TaxID=139825 RepID=A0A401G969_9APHY|nr:hypothetical protein SCP_0116050 [Sparassis crispa]GBE78714.1 hypothetical protein SCP_0116050 [Sparassis crispa]
MGCADPRIIRAVWATIDFIYYASLQSHTTQTLAALQEALDGFHAHKDIFIELGARNQDHFNIPKIHAMKHYVAMIKLFGSADEFNTESPECLHIDYAKDAYRASNRKDYLYQMVIWLRQQEAVDRFALYLNWCKNGGYHGQVAPVVSLAPEDGKDPEAIEATQMSRDVSTSLQVQYKIAKHHPHALRGVIASDIILYHHASHFVDCLGIYLRDHGSSFKPHLFDSFNLYARLSVTLPQIPAANPSHCKNVVRASPPVPAQGRRTAQHARLDFALVRTGEFNPVTAGTPLEGLRVAHIRVLFALPEHYPVLAQHPLAYIEWFTPLRRMDPDSELFVVSPSTRMHQPYGEIISIDRIVRNCHLVPNFGREMDSRWTTQNVTELCTSFYLNPYIDTHMFCMLRAKQYGCLP